MREHILKTWPCYWDAVASGEKKFEVRRDDRGFQKGDVLVLQRTYEDSLHRVEYSGMKPRHELRKRITYILTGGQFGIEPGYVVMSLEDEVVSRKDETTILPPEVFVAFYALITALDSGRPPTLEEWDAARNALGIGNE